MRAKVRYLIISVSFEDSEPPPSLGRVSISYSANAASFVSLSGVTLSLGDQPIPSSSSTLSSSSTPSDPSDHSVSAKRQKTGASASASASAPASSSASSLISSSTSFRYSVSGSDLFHSLKEHLRVLYGDVGMLPIVSPPLSPLAVLHYDALLSLFVVRCARQAEPAVRNALAMLRDVKGRQASLRVRAVAGCKRTLTESVGKIAEFEVVSRKVPEGAKAKEKFVKAVEAL